jgi:hypothetical protein
MLGGAVPQWVLLFSWRSYCMRMECASAMYFVRLHSFFLAVSVFMRMKCAMKKKSTVEKPKKKPLNITLSDPLRDIAEAVVEAQKSGSITGLIEEALREKFTRMGLPTDVSPERVLEELVRLREGKTLRRK